MSEPIHTTENPLTDIDINGLDALFNTPPEDLTRDTIDNIVRIMRTLRGRRIEVSGGETKVVEPKAPRKSKKKVAAEINEPFVPGEDLGF